jgi:hypothetical protein
MITKETVQRNVPGWRGLFAFHDVCYNGDLHPHKGPKSYNPNDPKVIAKRLDLMQLDGGGMVIATWEGITAAIQNTEMITKAQLCIPVGMKFALLLDPGCANRWIQVDKATGRPSGWTPQMWTAYLTKNVIESLQAVSTQAVINSLAYHEARYVLDFNTGADLVAVKAAVKDINILPQDVGFSWPPIPFNVNDYKRINSNPAMKIAGVFEKFCDAGMPLPEGVQQQDKVTGYDRNRSTWGGPARVEPGNAGQLLFSQWATINPSTPIIAKVTRNDYDEETEDESESAALHGVNWL